MTRTGSGNLPTEVDAATETEAVTKATAEMTATIPMEGLTHGKETSGRWDLEARSRDNVDQDFRDGFIRRDQGELSETFINGVTI